MAVQQKVDFKYATLKVKDDGSNYVDVKFDDGEFNWTRTKNYERILDRGVLDTVREGDQAHVEVTFQARYDYIRSSGSDITLYDAFYQENGASGWVSTTNGVTGQSCAPYAVDLELTYSPTCSGGLAEPDEVLLFQYFRAETCNVNTKAGTLDISGFCNITKPTATRS